MEKIKIGKIVSAVGLKGEVRVYNYSDSDEVYRRTPTMFAGDNPVKIENVRTQKHMVILKLIGIDDRDSAERIRGCELFITEEDLPMLPEGQFYVRDLIGMSVWENGGGMIGTVTDVIQNTAQDILEVEREGGRKVLIPKVDEFIVKIDGVQRRIDVKLIDGLLEL